MVAAGRRDAARTSSGPRCRRLHGRHPTRRRSRAETGESVSEAAACRRADARRRRVRSRRALDDHHPDDADRDPRPRPLVRVRGDEDGRHQGRFPPDERASPAPGTATRRCGATASRPPTGGRPRRLPARVGRTRPPPRRPPRRRGRRPVAGTAGMAKPPRSHVGSPARRSCAIQSNQSADPGQGHGRRDDERWPRARRRGPRAADGEGRTATDAAARP